MRNRTPSASRRHQLVLSLSPHCLNVLHFQRGLLGWKRTNEAQLTLPEGDDFLPQIQFHLSQCSRQWKLPPNTRAQWVLGGDILSVIPPATSETGTFSALPFAANDTRTQSDQMSDSDHPSLMWIHKDWVAEIERISAGCQLDLVEFFARAQLFQRQAARLSGAFKVVIEQESDQYFLHIFGSTGAMLRTTILEKKETTALHPLLKAELAGLGPVLGEPKESQIYLQAPAQLIGTFSEWQGFECHVLDERPPADLLEQLWRSELEGIVVRSTYDEVVQNIKLLSIALAIVGLIVTGLMMWHDGKLQQAIDDGRQLVRKDLPKVEAAKALKAQTLQMADAVQAAKIFRENTGSLMAFTQILANFPPAPATLLYVRTDENSLAFVGNGDQTSVKWLQDRAFPGYAPLTELPVPEFLESGHPAIHVQTRKAPAPLPSVALPASIAASRTTAE